MFFVLISGAIETKHHKWGLRLVEITIVTAIIAFLASLAAPVTSRPASGKNVRIWLHQSRHLEACGGCGLSGAVGFIERALGRSP